MVSDIVIIESGSIIWTVILKDSYGNCNLSPSSVFVQYSITFWIVRILLPNWSTNFHLQHW